MQQHTHTQTYIQNKTKNSVQFLQNMPKQIS